MKLNVEIDFLDKEEGKPYRVVAQCKDKFVVGCESESDEFLMTELLYMLGRELAVCWGKATKIVVKKL